jgi:hypothetical protein
MVASRCAVKESWLMMLGEDDPGGGDVLNPFFTVAARGSWIQMGVNYISEPALALLLGIALKTLDNGLENIWRERIFDFKDKIVWFYLVDFVGFYIGILRRFHFVARLSLWSFLQGRF